MKSEINHAVREMAKSVSGGHAAVAAVLGYTKPALENRLYEVKGQRIGIDEAMLIQRISGRTDFAEAVASESGGVFVPLPEDVCCAALAEEEISTRFLNIMERGGEMVRKWRESTADGEVTAAVFRVMAVVQLVLLTRPNGAARQMVAAGKVLAQGVKVVDAQVDVLQRRFVRLCLQDGEQFVVARVLPFALQAGE